MTRDEQINALKASQGQQTDPVEVAKIQGFIDSLQAGWAAIDAAANAPKAVAPALPPAASDLWAKLPLGAKLTIDGVDYVMENLGGCGLYPCKQRTTSAQPTASIGVAEERAASVKYATGVLFMDDNPDVQASWKAYLTWLSKRPS